MSRYEDLQRKADALLKEGDALGVAGKKAESRRTLRKCLRVRMQARALLKQKP